jgi:hypothetical protein
MNRYRHIKKASAPPLALNSWWSLRATCLQESVIDVEALASVVAGLSDETPCLEPSLDDVSECIDILCQEIELRKKLNNNYKGCFQESHGNALSEGRWVCSLCKHNCHFSVMFCEQCDQVTCVRHTPEEVCSCAKKGEEKIVLYLRHQDKVLTGAVRELRTRQRGALRANTGAASSMIMAARKGLPSQKADPMLKPASKRAPPSSDSKAAPKAKTRRLSDSDPVGAPCLHKIYKQRKASFVSTSPIVIFGSGGLAGNATQSPYYLPATKVESV